MPKKGKKGVEQRTKGNVKAASSGRMSELMGGDSGFIGFDVVSSNTSSVSSNGSTPDEVLKYAVTSNFQAALKQMSKRDTTTKMKALNEFISLCDREPTESVMSCLKLWPLMYGKVSTDNDHRVRELSHLALRSCGLVVKKQLGPHVRSLMGAWVSGMCDPHSQSAIAAHSAFTDIFSPEKQMEVYKFALKDVVLFIQNLVLKESADTYTDPKIYPEDERIERYERAVSMAICGLGHILSKLGNKYLYEEEGVAGVWQEILKQSKLWKLSKHKNPLIRSSVFRLVCSLANSTQYLPTDMKLFCSIVFGSLSESDSVVIGPLWDAVLFIMDSDKEWPNYVNIQKGLLPGLWLLLEGGSHGNAGRVFPCLLPLINGLVRYVYTHDVNFSLNFLQRLSKSFQADSVRISTSETEAVMNSLKECFSLLLKLNRDESIQFMKLIFDLFSTVMSEDISTLQYSTLSNGVAMVIINGLRIVRSDDSSSYDRLVEYCRDTLMDKVSQIISNTDNLSDKVVERLGDFLVSFHTSHAPQSSHTPSTLFILPVICKACSLCLLGATPTQICLFQRLISHYNDCTNDLVKGISTHVKPDQPVDSTSSSQLDELVNHMISLCDHNKIEPLLVDSVVSLLCSRKAVDTLVAVAKEKLHLAPLIVAKAAQKGCDDIGGIVDQLEGVLVPTVESDTGFSQYYMELWAAMLTRDSGVPSLQGLSVADAALSRLCNIVMNKPSSGESTTGIDDDDGVINILSRLDVTIIKRNSEILTRLLTFIHQTIVNDNTNLSEGFLSCHNNILPHLPNKDTYISSAINKLSRRISNSETLNEVLWLSVCFKCLYCSVLDTFQSVYQLLITSCSQPITEVTSNLPTSVFQMFCEGTLQYSPSPVSISMSICSSIPKSLFPFLLMGVCLLNDGDLLHEISDDRFETQSLLRNTVSINSVNDDIIVPALFFLSAVSIYSSKGSLAYMIGLLAIERLLDDFNSYSALVLYLIDNLCDSHVGNLCLNTILHVSHFNSTLVKTILSNASELKIQLVLHEIEDQQIVEDLLQQNQHDPCIITGCLLLMKRESQLITGAASLTLSTIVERHNAKELTILDDDTDSSRDPMVFSVLELMIQLLTVKGVEAIDPSTWDFVMCQSVAIVQLLIDSYKWLSLEGVVMFCRGLSLCCRVHSCLTKSSNATTASEWKEFFLPTIQEVLLPHLLNIKGSFPSDDRTFLHYYVCNAVVELSIQPPSDMWEELIAMVSICRLYSEQVTGFILAQRVIKTMTFKCTGDETEGVDISVIQSYLSSFLFNFDVDSIFDLSSELDDSTSTTAIDNENTQQIVSYLLLWLLICEIVGKCDIEARVVLTEWIKEKCQLNSLLKGMLPYCSGSAPQQVKGVTLIPSVVQLSNAVYFSIAQHLPPMLRQWYNSLDKQVSTQVMNFTSKNVTPRLWSNEVKNIHNSKPKSSDLEIKVYSSAMEVFVAYHVDEFSIELSVNVPDCYPLLAPTISEGKRAKVEVSLWRKWLLQLSAFIANQNGTILEGLMVWKSNLDKHFAGLEDCMICFSVIHGSNYSLPKMCCRTCKKKFHSSCLYKWFSTSAKSTCPLCRNVF